MSSYADAGPQEVKINLFFFQIHKIKIKAKSGKGETVHHSEMPTILVSSGEITNRNTIFIVTSILKNA